MPITQRTATSGTAASSGALTVTFPTGASVGDVIILAVANAGTAGPVVIASWTSIGTFSAGTAQSITVFWAIWTSGLSGSFTNAASVAAWTCNAFIGGEDHQIDASAATSNTTNNTTLPTGAPISRKDGDYEVLCYCWKSAATISTVASGSTIDITQANSTTVSCAMGHNNTTSLSVGTVTTAFSQTLSANDTRKTGVGVLLFINDSGLLPFCIAPQPTR